MNILKIVITILKSNNPKIKFRYSFVYQVSDNAPTIFRIMMTTYTLSL